MRRAQLNEMVGGWFVGAFQPTALATEAAEVAVKYYAAGDREPRHVHKIATEVTVIVSGEVEMERVRYGAGDIIVLEPGDVTDFHVLADTVTVVVKVPSVLGDKYSVDG